MSNLNLKQLARSTGGVVVEASAKQDGIQRIVDRAIRYTGIEGLTYSSQQGGVSLEDKHGHQLTPRSPLKKFDAFVEVFIAGFDFGSGKRK